MTDRELLEAAAKAAGIALEWERDPAFVQERWQAMVPCGWVGQPSLCEWNPLREDGHALRLAVNLGLTVAVDLDEGCTRILNEFDGVLLRHMHVDGGAEAATRRAIVRAAAAIGASQ